MRRLLTIVCVLPVLAVAGGCASVGVTLAGLGAGVGLNHYSNNLTARTFTEPLADVTRAVHLALQRMDIPVEATSASGPITTISARAGTREIDIELESITASATRMQSIARREGSLLLDAATGAEIIAQTERALVQPRPWEAAQQD
jgi:hypothetical protein